MSLLANQPLQDTLTDDDSIFVEKDGVVHRILKADFVAMLPSGGLSETEQQKISRLPIQVPADKNLLYYNEAGQLVDSGINITQVLLFNTVYPTVAVPGLEELNPRTLSLIRSWESTDMSGLTDGASVPTLGDYTGNNWTAVTAAKFKAAATGAPSIPSLQFVGNANYDTAPIAFQNGTFIFVENMVMNANDAVYCTLLSGNIGTGNDYMSIRRRNYLFYVEEKLSGALKTAKTSSGTLAGNQINVHILTLQAGVPTYYINAVNTALDNSTPLHNAALGLHKLGALISGSVVSQYYNGELFATHILNDVVTEAQAQLIYNFYKNKLGI